MIFMGEQWPKTSHGSFEEQQQVGGLAQSGLVFKQACKNYDSATVVWEWTNRMMEQNPEAKSSLHTFTDS